MAIFNTDKGAVGGVITISNNVINDLVSGNLTPVAGWIAFGVGLALFATTNLFTAARRRSPGAYRRISITILTIVAVGSAQLSSGSAI